MILNPLKTGPWKLTDLKDVMPNGMKVFSCFHCGGGSTMGYKLAGYEVLGGVEIDPEMSKIYVKNHNPKYEYLMGVQEFKNIPNDKLPPELFDLDILDGSPPCSSFSMAGSREKKWGKKKKFREGQAEQILDDLFFDFIDVAKKLKPKVVVAENVKGLIQGNARGYVKLIFKRFRDAGYSCQLFLLNAASMGVPQKRERTFFIANRIGLDKIRMEFNEKTVTIDQAFKGVETIKGSKKLTDLQFKYWNMTKPGNSLSTVHPKGSWFTYFRLDKNNATNTLISGTERFHYIDSRTCSDMEYKRIQSFPDDYDQLKTASLYICGMSVPPFMMQRVADQIYKQWLWPYYEGLGNGKGEEKTREETTRAANEI